MCARIPQARRPRKHGSPKGAQPGVPGRLPDKEQPLGALTLGALGAARIQVGRRQLSQVKLDRQRLESIVRLGRLIPIQRRMEGSWPAGHGRDGAVGNHTLPLRTGRVGCQGRAVTEPGAGWAIRGADCTGWMGCVLQKSSSGSGLSPQTTPVKEPGISSRL